MKLLCTATVAAAMLGGLVVTSAPAHAHMADPGLKLPSAAEQIACRTVRERVRRPSGALVWKTRRICTPGYAMYHPRCDRTSAHRAPERRGRVQVGAALPLKPRSIWQPSGLRPATARVPVTINLR